MRGVEQIPWIYDAMCWLAERNGLIRWRRKLVAGAEGRTLEVGVGTGRNLPLYDRDLWVVGLELDRGVLAAARRRAPWMPLVVASAEHVPFADGAFDTVVSGFVFCTVPDPHRGLREIGRVLTNRGELRMLEHVRSTRPLWARWQDTIQPLWTWVAGGCHPNRDTETTVEAAGFMIHEEGRRRRGNLRLFNARKAAT
jgi:ubiquinone/menaquinone biosynthesis C-methylase UbiE